MLSNCKTNESPQIQEINQPTQHFLHFCVNLKKNKTKGEQNKNLNPFQQTAPVGSFKHLDGIDSYNLVKEAKARRNSRNDGC